MNNQTISIPKNTPLLTHPSIEQVTTFQCKDGYCGTCKSKILKGHVTYLQEPISQLEEGEVLPCICVSTTEVVIAKI